MIKKLIFLSALGMCLHAGAQVKEFTLKQCIDYAWDNNLDVRQYTLNNALSKIDARQSKTNLLPSLSLNAGQNYQFGRTIDRFTNTFVNQTIRSNNVGLSGNLVLFNGMQNQHYIMQQNAAERATEENILTIKNTIALNVASAFLQVIQSEEIIKNSKIQIESTTARIDKAQKMVDAGASDMSALLSLKAQVANEQLNLVTAQNQKNVAMLNLKILMQMPPEDDLEVVVPVIPSDVISNPYTLSELYDISLKTMPQIKAAVLQTEVSKYQSMVAKGQWSPTISLYGSVSTVYSQSAKDITGVNSVRVQPIGITQNTLDTVFAPSFGYSFKTIPFKKQLKDNLGQSAGINISWNLFNGFQVQNQVQKAKINSYISEVNLQRAKNTLLNDINTAMNNYNAAKARHDAATNNIQAQQLSFDYIQRRFDAGATNSFDYIQSKNGLLQAQSTEVQARYELVFRGLILEYYKGNPINL